jgi:D-alanyl-D-alanine dipeptidase
MQDLTPLPPAIPQQSACPVAPLDPVADAEAQQLETSLDVVNVAGMVPAAAGALERFQTRVQAIGGSIVLKSAYRPAAYQQHLQNVWYKWMTELRSNSNPDCQELKAQVRDEFTRHRLIETQHPVAVSDHTRGLAFDATVDLPAHARIGRRRVTLDSLARLAGLTRPAIAADPVHFKFVGSTRILTAAHRVSRNRRNA